MKEPVDRGKRQEKKMNIKSSCSAELYLQGKKTRNFQRKLNFALIDMIKQLYSSNATNTFFS